MKILEDERHELDSGLNILKSKNNVDRDTLNAFKLQELSKLEKQIIEEIGQERSKIQELQEDVSIQSLTRSSLLAVTASLLTFRFCLLFRWL